MILRRTGNRDFNGRTEFEIALHAFEFLAWCSENFRCFWLTSRSRDGSHAEIERAFRFAIPTTNLPTDVLNQIRSITPARWLTEKISGIDMSRDFFWLDDNPDNVSLAKLQKENMSDRFIRVSTDHASDDLGRAKKILEEHKIRGINAF